MEVFGRGAEAHEGRAIVQDRLLAKPSGLDGLHLSEAVFFTGQDLEAMEVLPNVFWNRNGLHWKQPLFREDDRSEQRIDKHVQKIAYRLLKYQLDRDCRYFDQLGLIQDDESIEIYKAFLVASAVHLLHADESGQAHINHLVRVFKSFFKEGGGSSRSIEELQAILLKDVIRGSRTFFYRDLMIEDLAFWGFGPRTLELVADLAPLEGAWEPDVHVLHTSETAAEIKRQELIDYLGPVFLKDMAPAFREQWKTQKELLLNGINNFEYLPRPAYRFGEDEAYSVETTTAPQPLITNNLKPRETLKQFSRLAGEYNYLARLENWQSQHLPDFRGGYDVFSPNPFEDIPNFIDEAVDKADAFLVKRFAMTLMRELRGGVWNESREADFSFELDGGKSSTRTLFNQKLTFEDLSHHARKAILNWRQITHWMPVSSSGFDEERDSQQFEAMLHQYSTEELVAMYLLPGSEDGREFKPGNFKSFLIVLEPRLHKLEAKSKQQSKRKRSSRAVVDITPEDLQGDGLNVELGRRLRQEILRQWDEED